MPRIADAEFCVIDFETTGRSASKGGRAIELGMVRIDAEGNELGRFCSLFHGGGRPGPTRVHKITASHLIDAPRFEEVVGHVLPLLDGSVVVAHNIGFDASFLREECRRAGVRVPDFRRLCTVRLTRKRFPGYPSYSLGRITRQLGITLQNAHTAAADAAATAGLLAKNLRQIREDGDGEADLYEIGVRGRSVRWPSRTALREPWTRAEAESAARPRYAAGTLFADEAPAPPPATVTLLEPSDDSTMYVRLIDRLLTGAADLATMRKSLAGFSAIVQLADDERAAIHRDYLARLSGESRTRAAALLDA